MNAEKMIKTEAKQVLSGKWTAAVMAVFILLFMPIIAAMILMAAYSVLGESEISDVLQNEPVKMAVFAALHVAAIVAFLLLSPIFTGFARFYSRAAAREDADLIDVFYFFENGSKYKRAIAFMSGLLVKCVGILVVCEAAAVTVAAVAHDNDVTIMAAISLAIVGAVAAFLWFHRFAFQVMLFSYKDYDAASAAKTGAQIASGNTGKLIKLTVSFVPWLLLMFFVVPFLYVYPYMTCSYFVSVKYIVSDYFEKQKAREQMFTPDTPAVNDNTEALANSLINNQDTIATEQTDVSSPSLDVSDNNEAAEQNEKKPLSLDKSSDNSEDDSTAKGEQQTDPADGKASDEPVFRDDEATLLLEIE